jgi:hypothetical protein
MWRSVVRFAPVLLFLAGCGGGHGSAGQTPQVKSDSAMRRVFNFMSVDNNAATIVSYLGADSIVLHGGVYTMKTQTGSHSVKVTGKNQRITISSELVPVSAPNRSASGKRTAQDICAQGYNWDTNGNLYNLNSISPDGAQAAYSYVVNVPANSYPDIRGGIYDEDVVYFLYEQVLSYYSGGPGADPKHGGQSILNEGLRYQGSFYFNKPGDQPICNTLGVKISDVHYQPGTSTIVYSGRMVSQVVPPAPPLSEVMIYPGHYGCHAPGPTVRCLETSPSNPPPDDLNSQSFGLDLGTPETFETECLGYAVNLGYYQVDKAPLSQVNAYQYFQSFGANVDWNFGQGLDENGGVTSNPTCFFNPGP